MKYKNVVSGMFIDRPNRFIANVLIDGVRHTVHVKNTGRCKELLVEGASVYLSYEDNPIRKTKYDLIAVEKRISLDNTLLINIDSQIVNDVVEEWLTRNEFFGKDALIKREVKHKNSRFDFYIEHNGKKCFLEVKGVTLENNKIASFPDAPTERGLKHLKELTACIEEGIESYFLSFR